MNRHDDDDFLPAEPANPYASGNGLAAAIGTNAAGLAVQTRELAELRGAIMLAREFRRDPVNACDAIMADFRNIRAAESASYAFKRGSDIITGPSIRAAEAIARRWGNIRFEWREISHDKANNRVTLEAFAWDLETNMRSARTFTVELVRVSRSGRKVLTDPRDIYEHCANSAARRMRACILDCIPSEVVDAAISTANRTIADVMKAPEAVRKMVDAFAAIGVTQPMLEQFLAHPVDAAHPAELVRLRGIYQSLRDGVAKISDFFGGKDGDETPADKAELAEKVRGRRDRHEGQSQAAPADPNPSTNNEQSGEAAGGEL
jgi:hypothetical protein